MLRHRSRPGPPRRIGRSLDVIDGKEDPASALEGRRKRERDAHVRRGVQALPVENAFAGRTLESGVGDQDLLGEGGVVVRGA